MSMSEFEPPQENEEQITVKDYKLLTTNLTVESQNRKVEGPITYSLDVQIFKFKVMNGHEEPQEPSNYDKLLNLELWGVNVDFKSYEKKWTIHGIIQNTGFYPPTENSCVMMRENLKTKCCEYIVVYQDDLHIASPTSEAVLNILQNQYKLNINPEFYLGASYLIDQGETIMCQLSK